MIHTLILFLSNLSFLFQLCSKLYGCFQKTAIFSSFISAHAQAMNEYREGEMSTEVNRKPKFVDGNCGP